MYVWYVNNQLFCDLYIAHAAVYLFEYHAFLLDFIIVCTNGK